MKSFTAPSQDTFINNMAMLQQERPEITFLLEMLED